MRVRYSLASLMAVMVAASLGASCIRLMSLKEDKRGITASEANAIASDFLVPQLTAPDDATDVDISVRLEKGWVSFNLDETRFLAWCNNRGWSTQSIAVPAGVSPHFFLKSYPRTWQLSSGNFYYYSNATHRGGFTVVYERDRQRTWVHYAPR